MSAFLRKYATATHVYLPVVKRGVVDFAVGADWTPAAGDVKVSLDGGAAANIGTLPTAVAMGNTAYWDFPLAAGETTGKKVVVTVADSATKAVEDQSFLVETYGHASAEYQADLSAANLPANVTQLLGTAWLTPGTAGTPDVNAKQVGGTAQTARDLGNALPAAAPNANGGLPILSVSGTTLGYTVTTLTTYTGNTPQTGDNFTRIGANGAGLTALGDTRLANLDAAVSSRSTYAGADTSGTTTLLSRLTSTRAGLLDNLDAAITSRMATFTYTTPPTAVAVATAVWTDLTSGSDFSTANSVGKLLKDNVNAAIGSRSSHTAADVWAAATRTLSAGVDVASVNGSADAAAGLATAGTDYHSTGRFGADLEAIEGNDTITDNVFNTFFGGPLNNPPTAAAVAAAVWANAARTLTAFSFTVTAGTVSDKTGYSLAAAGLDAVLVESAIAASAALVDDAGTQLTTINPRQALAAILSAVAAQLAGAATTTVTTKPAAKPAASDRITATVDADGNRSAVSLRVPT